MEYETILHEIHNNVAIITLNRPDAANSINLNLAKDFMNCVLACREETSVRAVIITSTGGIFCSGGDLKAFAAEGDNLPKYLKETTTYLHSAISLLTRMDPPVVAAVQGSAGGAGLSLACSCDMVIAADSARFTMGYTQVGLTPDGGSTYFLSRIVGLKRAFELVLTNRTLSAHEAFDYGIITRMVPDKEVFEQAFALAAKLAAGATIALGRAKRLIHNGWSETLETQMQHESEAISDVARTVDAQKGINAFLEKRTPVFKGD